MIIDGRGLTTDEIHSRHRNIKKSKTLGKRKQPSVDDIEHFTRNIRRDVPAHEFATSIYYALRERYTGNGWYGACLEMALWATFIRYEAWPIKDYNFDYSAGKATHPLQIDVDFLFEDPDAKGHEIMILAKTSLRERWKQPDRDAQWIHSHNRNSTIWLAIMVENAGDTLGETRRKLEWRQASFWSKMVGMSIMDPILMVDMLTSVGAKIDARGYYRPEEEPASMTV